MSTERKPLSRLEMHYLTTNIKGIMMLFLVLYHFMHSGINGIVSGNCSVPAAVLIAFGPLIMALVCAVPMFVFVTGLSCKDVDSCRETAFTLYFIPYLLLSVLMALEYGLLNGFPVYFFPLEPLMQLWYLMSMFLWMLLLKDLVKIRGILVVSYLVSLLIGMYFSTKVLVSTSGVDSFLSLSRTLYFLPFLILGFQTKPEFLSRLRNAPRWLGIPVGAAFAGGAAALVAVCVRKDITGLKAVLVLKGAGRYSDYLPDMDRTLSNLYGALLTVLLTVFCLLLIFLVIRFVPKKKIPFLTRLGDASLTVFSLHVFVTIPISRLLAKLPLAANLGISVAATAGLCFLLSWRVIHKNYSCFIFRLGSLICKN